MKISVAHLQASEVSEMERSATAKLTITVKPVDSNPPVIEASAVEGFVDENAPIGTKVIDQNGNPITLTVSDADLVRPIIKVAFLPFCSFVLLLTKGSCEEPILTVSHAPSMEITDQELDKQTGNALGSGGANVVLVDVDFFFQIVLFL